MPLPQPRPSDPESWRRVLDEQAQSGLSQRAFADARGWPPYLLSYWKRCLLDRALAPVASAPEPTFVPVTLTVATTPARPAQRASFELQLPGARALRIPPDFDPDTLQRLLRVLHEAPC